MNEIFPTDDANINIKRKKKIKIKIKKNVTQPNWEPAMSLLLAHQKLTKHYKTLHKAGVFVGN